MTKKKARSGTLYCIVLILFTFLKGTSLYAGTENIKQKIEGEKRLFTIEVRDAELADVVRALADQSGLNVIIGEGVSGKVTLSFEDITFKDAMEAILRAHGLGYALSNNVLWVGLKKDVSEVGDELEEELSMEVVQLNYTDPSQALNQLEGILSKRGTAVADARTNSVIIRDLSKHVEEARGVLHILDKRSTQVVIEARIVEAGSNFAKELGIQWGGEYSSGGDVIRGSSLLPNLATGRNFVVDLPAAASSSGLGILIGSLSNNLILDAELSAAEREGDLRIVSRPKITTLNNRPATIHSGLTFRVKLTQSVVAGQAVTGALLEGLEEVKTGIDLSVTPHISADDFVLLDIFTNKSDADFSRTVEGIPSVTEKSASTQVLVKDGDTVVIGGLYQSTSSTQENSVPFLGKIPVLGWIFKNSSETSEKDELLVFITPTIVKYETLEEVVN
jgi:type IV pilus assembly protein PilQ